MRASCHGPGSVACLPSCARACNSQVKSVLNLFVGERASLLLPLPLLLPVRGHSQENARGSAIDFNRGARQSTQWSPALKENDRCVKNQLLSLSCSFTTRRRIPAVCWLRDANAQQTRWRRLLDAGALQPDVCASCESSAAEREFSGPRWVDFHQFKEI